MRSTVVLFFGLAVLAPTYALDCDSWLSRSWNVISYPVKAARKSFSQFASEVREVGPIRIVLAPRQPEPVWQRLLSLNLPVSKSKQLSRVVSFPLGILAGTALLIQIDQSAINSDIRLLEQASREHAFAAESLSNWVIVGGLNTNTAREVFLRSQTDFVENLKPLRNRVADYRSFNWWSETAGSIGLQILDDLAKNYDAAKLYRSDELIKHFQKHPRFSDLVQAIPPQYFFTLDLLTAPKIFFSGQSDVEWLKQLLESTSEGALSIKAIMEAQTGLVTLPGIVKMTALTLRDERISAEKRAKAKALGLPKSESFSRADIPLLSQNETFHDLTREVRLSDEIDQWHLILTDPRFVNFRSSWESKAQSDDLILTEAKIFRQSLEEVYRIYKTEGDRLSLKTSCSLVKSNLLFRNLVDESVAEQLGRAQIYFRSFIKGSEDPAQWSQILAKGLEEEKELVRNLKDHPPGHLTCPGS